MKKSIIIPLIISPHIFNSCNSKNGLINIKYNVKQDKINIVFSYDGGVTEIDIEKFNNNVLKRIVYYAD